MPPNFLLLLADDMGWGDWPSFPAIYLPHLDSLARSGVRFTQFYSASSICSPARGAMLTGRLPVRWGGAGGNWKGTTFGPAAVGGLPSSEETVAEALRARGYATAMGGKWHLGQRPELLPRAQGFDEYLGLAYSADMGSSAWEYMSTEAALPLLRNEAVLEAPVDLASLSQKIVDFGSAFIANATSKRVPWLLYVGFHQPHVPQAPGARWCNASARGRYGDALMEMDVMVGAIVAFPCFLLCFLFFSTAWST
jgi:hypothetical protein